MARTLIIALALAAAFATDASAVGAGMSKNAPIAPHCHRGQYLCRHRCISRAQTCHRPRPPRPDKMSTIVH